MRADQQPATDQQAQRGLAGQNQRLRQQAAQRRQADAQGQLIQPRGVDARTREPGGGILPRRLDPLGEQAHVQRGQVQFGGRRRGSGHRRTVRK